MDFDRELELGQNSLEAGDYGEAIHHFTAAIAASPYPECTYHVLNGRATAHRARGHFKKAIEDSKQAIALNIDDHEGYCGLAQSHCALEQWTEVLKACKRGYEIEPSVECFWHPWYDATNNVMEARIMTELVNPFGDTFQGKKVWEKLACSEVEAHLEEDDFIGMMRDVQMDTYALNKHLNDRRVLKAVSVLLNVNLRGFERADKFEIKEVPEVGEAVEGKEKNEDQAKGCEDDMKSGREVKADFPGRKSEALIKRATSMVKWAKSFVEFELLVDILRGALIRISEEITNMRKPLKEPERYNMELDEEHLKGNECFKQHLYREALEHYGESLSKNQRNAKAHRSRAECYIRLKEYTNALEEIGKYIKLDPTNPEGYALKATIQVFMQKAEEAAKTFEEGLKFNPTSLILHGGVWNCQRGLQTRR